MTKIIRLFVILMVVLSLVACSSSDNLEKPAPLVNFSPKIKVEKVWSQSIRGSDKKYLNLQIGYEHNTIYVTNYAGNVYAFNANTGAPIWHQDLKTNIISGVSVADKLAIVASADGKIIALNAVDGTVLWQKNIGNQALGLAAIAQGVVVLKTVADTVFALNAKNGQQLWEFNGSAPTLILRGGSQPKIIGSKVLIGFADGKLRAFSLHRGTLIWQQTIAQPQGGFAIQRMVDITVEPKVNKGIVYIVTYQGNIAALEVNNGQIIWHHQLSSYTGMALASAYLFVTDTKSHIYSFSLEDGNVAWKQTRLEARTITAPALLDNYLIVGDAEGYIHWLSQSRGIFMARQHLSGSPIRSTPIVAGNNVYLLDTDGDLAAYTIVK